MDEVAHGPPALLEGVPRDLPIFADDVAHDPPGAVGGLSRDLSASADGVTDWLDDVARCQLAEIGQRVRSIGFDLRLERLARSPNQLFAGRQLSSRSALLAFSHGYSSSPPEGTRRRCVPPPGGKRPRCGPAGVGRRSRGEEPSGGSAPAAGDERPASPPASHAAAVSSGSRTGCTD